jgi:hypothetical protein
VPVRLTYGAAAAALVAVTGVSVGAALSPSPAYAAVADSSPLSKAGPLGGTTAAAAFTAAGHPASQEGLTPLGPASAFGPDTPLDPSGLATSAHAALAEPGTTGARQATAGAQAQATAHTAPAQHPAVVPHQAAAQHQAAAPAQNYQIYDSVTPSAIPAGQDVATYATGPFAVPSSQVSGRNVLWIDTQGTDTGASALDVEPGDATPQTAASWAQAKLSANRNATAIIYTMISEWPQTQAAISSLPSWMHSHIRWWIADPTGVQHMVPGANATQWYWGQNYDISTAQPGF